MVLSWEYLNKLCFEGLEERYQPVTEELKSSSELRIIYYKKWATWITSLIVWDFIKYARDHDIMVGPGRVALRREVWLLIPWASHSLIPIRYDLLFGRFSRSGTSIYTENVDVELLKKAEVIEYVAVNIGMIV